MVNTPWGESTQLRDRMLGSGARQSTEAARQNQRERLLGALVACCHERGYGATTVSDVVACSGVSRRDFYRHFDDKQGCAEAAVEAILGKSLAVAERAFDGDGATLGEWLELTGTQPAAARLCLLEAPAIGPGALAALDRYFAAVAKVYACAQSEQNGAEMPASAAEAVVGGLRRVICRRLEDGREDNLGDLADPLYRWAFSYAPPPRTLPFPRPQVGQPARYRPDEPSERILAATLKVVAQKGYDATTVGEIVGAAGVSLTTLYQSFGGKEEALSAALAAGRARLAATAIPPFERAHSWPAAVRAGLEAALAFLAAEPDLAHTALVQAYGAGPAALAERDRALAAGEALFGPGKEHAPDLPALTPEAIVGAICDLLFLRIRRFGAASLPAVAPLATYLALCPFLGAEEAFEAARGRR